EIDEEWQQTQAAARALGLELHSVEVRSRDHLKSAVEAAVRHQADGLLVLADRLTWNYAYTIADLATKAGVPAMFSARHSADRMNGFMSYGADPVSLGQRAATLLDKILKGAKPADLPFEQPTTLELVINLKTAKALSLKIPPSVLIRADKVIQ
ncbi:MAG: ABC transporter substrate binding protein, partial [Candidatus Methylomirabilales bacterium]